MARLLKLDPVRRLRKVPATSTIDYETSFVDPAQYLVHMEWPGDEPATAEPLTALLKQGYGLALYGTYFYLHHRRLENDTPQNIRELRDNLAECRRVFAVEPGDAFHAEIVAKYTETDRGWEDEPVSEPDDEFWDPSYDPRISSSQVDRSLRAYADELFCHNTRIS